MTRLHQALFTLAVVGAASWLAAPGIAQQMRPEGVCEIYAAAGTPCVTAHSTVRILSSRYHGPLYQVKRQDGRLLNIGTIDGGFADAAAQDRFCAGTLCVINRIYDQSGKGNDLMQAPPGPLYPGPAKGAFDAQPIADMAPITIGGGHKAYGVYIMPGMGFRNNNARDLPIDDEPAGIHAVVDGKHYSNGCCFNYGNASTNGLAVGTGTMESVYFGTSTGWGSGAGKGPWIMSDMEAGLFSGYNARVNEANPSIDSWRFVTGVFGGGGRNFWELRGGDAQQGPLKTFYAGVRPGSKENNAYYPMHKKGAIQMGNGGDNGNGSAGTFYEGVMTAGHPGDGVFDRIQANIVAAKYDVPRLTQTRLTSFTPNAVKDVTATFTNTTARPMTGVALSLSLPDGWTAPAPARFASVAPGENVRATFLVTAPARASMGFMTVRAAWNGGSDTSLQRVRSVLPVKLNEVRFASGGNASDQFIELYNAAAAPVDISGWRIINTRVFSAPVTLATIPAGTRLAPRSHYLLALSGSGLAAPAAAGATSINVRSLAGLTPGQAITVGGESRTVRSVGTAATAPTKVFINVSTGPWLDFPAGTTNLPVHVADGFAVGDRIGIDLGGQYQYEVATVTAVGKAATQTTLAASTTPGATSIKLAALANVSAGDTLTIGTGQRMERAVVAAVGTPGAEGTGVTLTAPLKLPHTAGIDVWGRSTGISFAPATRFAHRSGDAVQALGSGVVLDRPLSRAHPYGAPVQGAATANEGYQGPVGSNQGPQQWFGGTLFITGGSIALMDASGRVVMDAIVYGSQQSNSSANGYITSPELATLEGVQHQGGCMAIVPGAGSGPATAAIAAAAAAPGAPNRSIGRFPDGRDTDSLCTDFMVQPATTLPEGAPIGATNIKVAGVADFAAGQSVMIGNETAVIASVGTAGSTRSGAATIVEATVIPVAATAGFVVGQSITIDSGANQESATIALVQGGRGGARITVAVPLKIAHPAGTPIAGSGISLRAPLTRAQPQGAIVTTELPTPGAANAYSNPRAAR